MEINIAELEESIGKLTPEELKQQLLDAKVKQRVNSKKYQNSDTQKRARLKKAATLKAQAELAKSMPATEPGFANLYEQIMSEAAELADQKLAAEEVEPEDAA
jgi:hypothetical protein